MLKKKINIAVAGATGFVGLDLVYLLSKHSKVKIQYLCAQKNLGKKIQYFDKRIKKKLPKLSALSRLNWNNIDLIFLSLPNGEAQRIIKNNIKYNHVKFIDLSADFRIEDPKLYRIWYGLNHKAKSLINKSLYSVSEFQKNKIKKFRIIANPGCYPTSIQLPLIPLLKKNMVNPKNIIIDSKSGFSGAGKMYKKKFTHKNIDHSIQAYGIGKHRHMVELDQEFKKVSKVKVLYSFTPHLLPTYRGILSSIYLDINNRYNITNIINVLKKYHSKNEFVKITKKNKSIGTGNVINTNLCEISVCHTRNKNKIIIFSAIDNLVKGASGQAIQNMNLIYGFKESESLK
jgi:N-acetyl-gamma-glutamyl-phosphate reductase|tara:strand:+ start:5499 stop:6530 length:1032 start_codon:yes stop_codon:yes gene_type:complete